MSSEQIQQSDTDRSPGSNFPALPTIDLILWSLPVALFVAIVDMFSPWFSLQPLFVIIIAGPLAFSIMYRLFQSYYDGDTSDRQFRFLFATFLMVIFFASDYEAATMPAGDLPFPTVLWFEGEMLIRFVMIVLGFLICYGIAALFGRLAD